MYKIVIGLVLNAGLELNHNERTKISVNHRAVILHLHRPKQYGTVVSSVEDLDFKTLNHQA